MTERGIVTKQKAGQSHHEKYVLTKAGEALRSVVFSLAEQSKEHQNAWSVFKNNAVELCIIDHDFDVDVQIEATTRNLTKLYMGWCEFPEAIKNNQVIFRGPEQYTKLAYKWFGRSRLAPIKKQPKELLAS